jgi:hypothetical protein
MEEGVTEEEEGRGGRGREEGENGEWAGKGREGKERERCR